MVAVQNEQKLVSACWVSCTIAGQLLPAGKYSRTAGEGLTKPANLHRSPIIVNCPSHSLLSYYYKYTRILRGKMPFTASSETPR